MNTFWNWETSTKPRLQAGVTVNLKTWGFGLQIHTYLPVVTLSFGPLSFWVVRWGR